MGRHFLHFPQPLQSGLDCAGRAGKVCAEVFLLHAFVEQTAQLLIQLLCPRFSGVLRQRLFPLARKCFYGAVQCANDLAFVAYMVVRQDLAGQRVSAVC